MSGKWSQVAGVAGLIWVMAFVAAGGDRQQQLQSLERRLKAAAGADTTDALVDALIAGHQPRAYIVVAGPVVVMPLEAPDRSRGVQGDAVVLGRAVTDLLWNEDLVVEEGLSVLSHEIVDHGAFVTGEKPATLHDPEMLGERWLMIPPGTLVVLAPTDSNTLTAWGRGCSVFCRSGYSACCDDADWPWENDRCFCVADDNEDFDWSECDSGGQGAAYCSIGGSDDLVPEPAPAARVDP